MRKLFAYAIVLIVSWGCADDAAPPFTSSDFEGPQAPLYLATSGQAIDGEYVVVLKDEERGRTAALDVAQSVGAAPDFVYHGVFAGFAAALDNAQVDALRRHPRVSFIEEQQVYGIVATKTQTGIDGVSINWGLDRIDQKNGLDGTYTYNNIAGRDVVAYVIDTGILPNHEEFFTGPNQRGSVGFDAFSGTGIDCNGHGTHVAGTIGGKVNGVAKRVELVGVRVLGCDGNGSTAGVIAGVDWVRINGQRPGVANLSLGGGFSKAMNIAVDRLARRMPVVVAAGNTNTFNSCVGSPAGAVNVITVAASDINDFPATFTSFGRCVDLFAPGVAILSAWHASTSDYASLSGTSMASPHVAGAVALYLQKFGIKSYRVVMRQITRKSTRNTLTAVDTPFWQYGTPNQLLNTEFLE